MTSSNESSESDYDDEVSENSSEESDLIGSKRKASMGHRSQMGKQQGNAETSKRSKTGNKFSGQGFERPTSGQIQRNLQDALTAYQPWHPMANPMPTVKGTSQKDLRNENVTIQKNKTSQMAKGHKSFQNVVHASGTRETPATQHGQNVTGQQFGANQTYWPDAHPSQFATNQPNWPPHMPLQFDANQVQWPNHTQYQQFGANQPQRPHMQYQFGANQPQWPNPLPFPTAQGTQAKKLPVNNGRPPQITKTKDQKKKLAEDGNASNAQNFHYNANQPNWSYPAQFPAVTPHSAPFPSVPPGMQVMGNGITIHIGSFTNVIQSGDPRTVLEPATNECKSAK